MLTPRQIRDYARCLPLIGLSPSEIMDKGPVPWNRLIQLEALSLLQFQQTFEHLAAQTPADYAALCGREIKPTHLGVLGHAMVNASTLGDMMQIWSRYCIVSSHPLVGEYRREDDEWVLELAPRVPLHPGSLKLCVEASLIGFTQMLEHLLERSVVLHRVELPFAEPRDSSIYDGLALGQLSFGRRSLRISGPVEALDCPLRDVDEEVRDVCEARCAERLQQFSSNAPVEWRVQALLDRSERLPGFEATAELLGMSQRAMHRSLQRSGIGFRELLEDARRRRTARLLRDGNCVTKQIAWQLGFDDVRSFQRVFRQWTGMSVGQWCQNGANRPLSRSGGI